MFSVALINVYTLKYYKMGGCILYCTWFVLKLLRTLHLAIDTFSRFGPIENRFERDPCVTVQIDIFFFYTFGYQNLPEYEAKLVYLVDMDMYILCSSGIDGKGYK